MKSKRNYTPEEAMQKLNLLPPSARGIIYSKEMGEILTKIGEKNSLHLDQLGDLESETVAFMLGFTEPEEFTSILRETLRVSPEAADAIANDVNTLLLKKEREIMEIAIPQQMSQIVSAEIPKEVPQQVSTPVNEPIIPVVHPDIAPISQEPLLQNPIRKELSPSENKGVGTTPNKYKVDPYREPIE